MSLQNMEHVKHEVMVSQSQGNTEKAKPMAWARLQRKALLWMNYVHNVRATWVLGEELG